MGRSPTTASATSSSRGPAIARTVRRAASSASASTGLATASAPSSASTLTRPAGRWRAVVGADATGNFVVAWYGAERTGRTGSRAALQRPDPNRGHRHLDHRQPRPGHSRRQPRLHDHRDQQRPRRRARRAGGEPDADRAHPSSRTWARARPPSPAPWARFRRDRRGRSSPPTRSRSTTSAPTPSWPRLRRPRRPPTRTPRTTRRPPDRARPGQRGPRIVKLGPATVTAGSNIVYSITVANGGPSDAAGVQVARPDARRTDLRFQHRKLHDTFPCALGTVPTGQSRVITATFHVPAGYSGPNPIVNQATVTSTTPDPNGDEQHRRRVDDVHPSRTSSRPRSRWTQPATASSSRTRR